MGLDRQLEQLCSVYTERSDAELLHLYEQRDDLTELAQQALAQVMQERKLDAHAAAPKPFVAAVDEDMSTTPLTGDEVNIMTFHDAFLAAEAIRNIKQAEIVHRVVDWNALSPGDRNAGPLQLGLVVRQVDAARAKQVLQQAMNLFPVAEGNDDFDLQEELSGLLLVGHFERADALRVAHALGSAGLSYIWTDGRDDATGDLDEVAIEVNGPRLEHAQKLAQQALDSEG